MLRDSVATESIYGFAQEQANAQPEEPIFVLTGSQLQEIITRAIQSLQDRIDTLEERTYPARREDSCLGAHTGHPGR